MAAPDQPFVASIEALIEAQIVRGHDVEPMAVLLPDAVAVLLAIRAAGRLVVPGEVRATGILDRPGAGWTRRDRARLVSAVSGGGRAWLDGRFVDEPVGSRRWLAWFPRPLGPHHAINVPSPAVAEITRHVPGLHLVRAHLAVRTWQAELLQAAGNLARFEAGRRRLRAWVERGPRSDDGTVRWATVVEVLGDDDRLVRGWAHGTGRDQTTDALALQLADVAWGDAEGAAAILDALATGPACDLRWSVGQPSQIER